MARRFYSSSAAATTLSSTIGSGDTSIGVAAITGFPVQYPYTLILDPDTASEEVISVTAGSGTTLTVARGQDGTTALAHTGGAVVEHGVSARDFDEPNAHIAASSAVHGIAGTVVGTTDTQSLTNKNLSSATNTFPATQPRGLLGYAEVTGAQGSIAGAETDLTGLTVTVTAGASRRIRIVYTGSVATSVAGDVASISIKEGATVLQQGFIPMPTAANFPLTLPVILAPSGGSHTYKISCARLSGTGVLQHTASATQPSFILVEDIGAA